MTDQQLREARVLAVLPERLRVPDGLGFKDADREALAREIVAALAAPVDREDEGNRPNSSWAIFNRPVATEVDREDEALVTALRAISKDVPCWGKSTPSGIADEALNRAGVPVATEGQEDGRRWTLEAIDEERGPVKLNAVVWWKVERGPCPACGGDGRERYGDWGRCHVCQPTADPPVEWKDPGKLVDEADYG